MSFHLCHQSRSRRSIAKRAIERGLVIPYGHSCLPCPFVRLFWLHKFTKKNLF
jgi:hypothetical protein